MKWDRREGFLREMVAKTLTGKKGRVKWLEENIEYSRERC